MRAPVTIHRGAVAGDELRGKHPFKLILRGNAVQGLDSGYPGLVAFFFVGTRVQGIADLVANDLVPAVAHRPAKVLQLAVRMLR